MSQGNFFRRFLADIDPGNIRNEVLRQGRAIDEQGKAFLQVNQLVEISPRIGDDFRLEIKKPASNVVRLAMRGEDMFADYGIHAIFGAFSDAQVPTVWIDADDGTFHAANGGTIGGWTIGATMLSAGALTLNSATPSITMGLATDYMTGTGVFLGQHSAVYKLHIGNPAGNNLSWDGSVMAANGQWIRQAGMNPSLQSWTTNIVFSSASDTQINWTSGTITLGASGTTYSISSGNTGAMAALNYIYLDIAVSTTVLQKTSTYSTAVGDGKILVAAAQNGTGGASVIPYGGQQPLINGGLQINALSIVAANIAAGAVTASKISVSNLAAVSATMGNLTIDSTLTMNGASGAITLGTTPPSSATVGTGLWIDRTGVYSLSSNTQNATLSSSGLSAGAGALLLDVNGLTFTTPGSVSAPNNIKWKSGSATMFEITAYTNSADINLNTGTNGTNQSANNQMSLASLAKAGFRAQTVLVAQVDSSGGALGLRVTKDDGAGPTEIVMNYNSIAASTVIKGNGIEVARFVSDGNVGIGTASPLGKIDVFANSGAASSWAYIRMNANGNNPSASFTSGLSFSWNKSGGAGESNVVYAGNRLEFANWDGTTYTARMVVESGGNVGIGTTAPGAKLQIGLAGTSLGTLRLTGNTSGFIQLQPAAAAGSWTMTLPTGNGTSGQQLQTDGAGVTSWAAASSARDDKRDIGPSLASPAQALQAVLATPVYDFRYRPGRGTRDQDTVYTGVMADEAPWAMHHNGNIINPINALGYTVLSIQALNQRIDDLVAAIGN